MRAESKNAFAGESDHRDGRGNGIYCKQRTGVEGESCCRYDPSSPVPLNSHLRELLAQNKHGQESVRVEFTSTETSHRCPQMFTCCSQKALFNIIKHFFNLTVQGTVAQKTKMKSLDLLLLFQPHALRRTYLLYLSLYLSVIYFTTVQQLWSPQCMQLFIAVTYWLPNA